MRLAHLLIILGFSVPALSWAQGQLSNGAEIQQALRSTGAINGSFEARDLSKLKVAIIDSGFEGFERYGQALGNRIREISMGQASSAGTASDKHGFAMLQLFMAASNAINLPEERRPEVLLVRAVGLSEFKKAVQLCLGKDDEDRVDLVIYSNNFAWGSDFAGGGFFNAEVAKATKAGITWINSAGNLGNTVYFADRYAELEDGTVMLPGQNNTLIFENRFDDQEFNVLLSWSDFTEDSEYATRKDLDFEVYSMEGGKLTAVPGGLADKRQDGRLSGGKNERVSGNAFEELSLRLANKGTYAIKIFARTTNFKARDKFQVTITPGNPQALNFISKNRVNEITAPADRRDVIAVGVASEISSVGQGAKGASKPDVILNLGKPDFALQYSDSFTSGLDTSSATAIFAGVVANLMVTDQGYSSEKLLSYLGTLRGRQWLAPTLNLGGGGPGAPVPPNGGHVRYLTGPDGRIFIPR